MEWIRDHYRSHATFGHPQERSRVESSTRDAALDGSGDALADILEQATGVRPDSMQNR